MFKLMEVNRPLAQSAAQVVARQSELERRKKQFARLCEQIKDRPVNAPGLPALHSQAAALSARIRHLATA